MAAACCAADLTGTLPIEGCAAATLIASASLRSFLLRLTNGLIHGSGRWAGPRTGSLRRDQPHAVPERRQRAPPVMRAAARFQRHLDRRQPREEGQQLTPPQIARNTA